MRIIDTIRGRGSRTNAAAQSGDGEYILASISDLHGNSTVGLSPPFFNNDDGNGFVANKAGAWLWVVYKDFCGRLADVHAAAGPGVPVIGLINGEIVDDLYHATTQLLVQNKADQIKMGLRILRPFLDVCDRYIVTRGTEAHSGLGAWLDETIAREIGAEGPQTQVGPDAPYIDAYGQEQRPSSWNIWKAKIGGVRIDAAHHPGVSSRRPWTRGGEAVRLAHIIRDRYVEADMKPPHLVIRGHNHVHADNGQNSSTHVEILPSFQLTNAFGYKIGGDWLPVGGMIAHIKNGDYTLEKPGNIPGKPYYRWPIVEDDLWTP